MSKAQVVKEIVGINAINMSVQDMKAEEFSSYDVIICAVDNIEGRMHTNFLFKQSTCEYLIDCGVSGHLLHVKIVNRNNACLFCIKELYEKEGIALCSAKRIVDIEDRRKFICNLYFKHMSVEKTVDEFNKSALENGRGVTDRDEVMFFIDEFVPSVVYMNSICASLVVKSVFKCLSGNVGSDFLALDMNGILQWVALKRDKYCDVCNEFNKQ